jgi:hypothetical protein
MQNAAPSRGRFYFTRPLTKQTCDGAGQNKNAPGSAGGTFCTCSGPERLTPSAIAAGVAPVGGGSH